MNIHMLWTRLAFEFQVIPLAATAKRRAIGDDLVVFFLNDLPERVRHHLVDGQSPLLAIKPQGNFRVANFFKAGIGLKPLELGPQAGFICVRMTVLQRKAKAGHRDENPGGQNASHHHSGRFSTGDGGLSTFCYNG